MQDMGVNAAYWSLHVALISAMWRGVVMSPLALISCWAFGCLTAVCGVADEHGSHTRQRAHLPFVLAVLPDYGTYRGHRVGRVCSLLRSCSIEVLLCCPRCVACITSPAQSCVSGWAVQHVF